MKDSRSIVITIKGGDDGAKAARAANATRAAATTAEAANAAEIAAIGTLANQAWSYAKSQIASEVGYEVSKAFALNDDYIGQRTMTEAKSILSRGVSMATTAAAALMVGGPIGGAIALAGTSISLGIQIAQNYDQERINLNKMSAQLSFTRDRAGYSLTSGSIGENK